MNAHEVTSLVKNRLSALRARFGQFLHGGMPTPAEIAEKTGVSLSVAESWHRELLRAREEFDCGKL
jgi:hypothetical protein